MLKRPVKNLQLKPVKTDTEGAIESACINGVSVLGGLK